MPKSGELTNEEKARAVLCRAGRPGNSVFGLTEAEVDELAGVYDECIAPEKLLGEKVRSFLGRHQQRLDDDKATVDRTPKKLFRNRLPSKEEPEQLSNDAAPET